RASVVALQQTVGRLRAEQEHRGQNRRQRVLPRCSIEYSPQHKERGQRWHKSLHDKVGDELRNIGLKVREPPCPIPPDGRGTFTPNDVNQLKSGCRVRKTTAQNIHFVNTPPIAKVIVPSRRRLTPANTSDSSAAEGASSSRTEITSFNSCGVPICP